MCLVAAKFQTVRLPFLQVMAGLGDPLVWQVNKAVLPSVTVWSDGGCVNVGAAPGTQRATEWQKTKNGFWPKLMQRCDL